jgi:hypothetical protein
MDYIFHLTTREVVRSIRKDKKLLPLSDPYSPEFFASKTARKIASNRVKSIVALDKYLVGIPESRYFDWEHSSLFRQLRRHISYGCKCEELITLRVPILSLEDAFIREAYYLSEEYMHQKGDRNIWTMITNGYMSPSQFVCRKYHRIYISSTIPLKNYSGEFKIPEIWLPQETPLSLVQIIEK